MNAANSNQATLEDMLAILLYVEASRRVIETQAFRSGSFDAIFEESLRQEADLDRLRRILSRRWNEISGNREDE